MFALRERDLDPLFLSQSRVRRGGMHLFVPRPRREGRGDRGEGGQRKKSKEVLLSSFLAQHLTLALAAPRRHIDLAIEQAGRQRRAGERVRGTSEIDHRLPRTTTFLIHLLRPLRRPRPRARVRRPPPRRGPDCYATAAVTMIS